jgi:sugar/nucleoside kinase (ribokinase family)
MNNVSCIHLGPVHPADIDPGVIEMVRPAKLPVVLDVQGYTRQIEGDVITTGVSQRLSDVLKISQVVKSTEFELEAIIDFFDLDISALIKTYRLEECVVTCGNEGGFVQDKKGNRYSYKASPVTSVLDPTGAGDVFFAAYLVSRFLNKQNIPNACGYAANLSALQVCGNYVVQDTLKLT